MFLRTLREDPAEAEVPNGTYSAEISSTDRIAVVVNAVRYR